MRRLSLLFLLLSLFLTPFVSAQSNVVLPTVQVQVFAQGQPAAGSPIRIQLLRHDGALTVVAETMTKDGMASFPNVHPGSYVLQLTGSAIEDTRTARFDVLEKSLTSMQYVRVRLKAVGEATTNLGTISANELNIPKPARDEFNKGIGAMQNNQWKEASSHLEKAVSIYPRYAAAYNNLGVISMKQKDTAKAKALFQKAIELDDNTGSAHLNLGRLYFMDRNFEEAARLLGKSLALDPNKPEALTILADCEFATGYYQDAITSAQRVHKLRHNRFAVAHLIAAAAYEKQDDLKDAIAEYEQFLKEDPNGTRAPTARKALERLAASTQPGGAAPKP